MPENNTNEPAVTNTNEQNKELSFNSLLMTILKNNEAEKVNLATFSEFDEENKVSTTLEIEQNSLGEYYLTQSQSIEGELDSDIQQLQVKEDKLSNLLTNLFNAKPHLKDVFDKQIKDRLVFNSVTHVIHKAEDEVKLDKYDDLSLLDLSDEQKEKFLRQSGESNEAENEKLFSREDAKTIFLVLGEQKNAHVNESKFELKEIENKTNHKKTYVMCETVKRSGVEVNLYSKFNTINEFKLFAGTAIKHLHPELEETINQAINNEQQKKKSACSFLDLMREPQVKIPEQEQHELEEKESLEQGQALVSDNQALKDTSVIEQNENTEQDRFTKEEQQTELRIPSYKNKNHFYIENNGTTPEHEALLKQYGRELNFYKKQHRSIFEVSKAILFALPKIVHDTALTFYNGIKEINNHQSMSAEEVFAKYGETYIPRPKSEINDQKQSNENSFHM